MRSCMKCRHAKRRVRLGWAIDYDYCSVRNGWPISHPVLRALTCPAYENDYKLVDNWSELHDTEVDDDR